MSKTICRPAVWLAAAMVFAAGAAPGAEPPAKFLGANSCASSSCHGGGGANQNQFLVWSLKDFHSQRPVATLATARAKQIADGLDIKDATADDRCTTCHAPLNSVPANLRGKDFKVSEGVSCESCHGPAENWLRSHTRSDYTHADRVAAGMRDLKNLYVRANTCVACHQIVDADILAAGHPELMFELDGQCVAEPKHWRESTNWNGAQAWVVGQAVALREMAWQVSREVSKQKAVDGTLQNQMEAMDWLLTHGLPITVSPPEGSVPGYTYDQKWGDEVARKMAAASWSNGTTRQYLSGLVKLEGFFRNSSFPQPLQARLAERLVLALDRLVTALPPAEQTEPLQAALKKLFADAQSLPDFKPAEFADHLAEFQKLISASKP